MFGGSWSKLKGIRKCARVPPETPLSCKRMYLSNPCLCFLLVGLYLPYLCSYTYLVRQYYGFLPYVLVLLCRYCFVYTYAGVSLFLLSAGLTFSMFTLSYAYNLAFHENVKSQLLACKVNLGKVIGKQERAICTGSTQAKTQAN